MPSHEQVIISQRNNGPSTRGTTKIMMVLVGIAVILSVASVAIGIATLVKVYRRSDDTPGTFPGSSTSVPTTSPAVTNMVNSIQIKETMDHLKELQQIADISNGNRAVNTVGFNRTLDYIYNAISTNTNFTPSRAFFNVRNFVAGRNQTLTTSINGTVQNRVYSTNFSASDFSVVQYTRPFNFAGFRPITVIPDVGCTDANWQNVTTAGLIALVKRGTCSFVDKGVLAAKYGVSALLIYNDGTGLGNVQPISISLGRNNELPAVFLSYTLGNELATAALNPANNVSVNINIDVADQTEFPVGNICADTPTGDSTKTIIIGSHSDSVPAGPGINDNVNHLSCAHTYHSLYRTLGSGSAANLALAAALSRLFRTSAYPKYKYRIRFCWFGAEEIGLLGSDFHVRAALNTTVVGERLQDYLINLNYDMLGSPNFIFGIYDGKTATNTTPVQALAGSNKVTAEFVEWFKAKQLPWTYTDFSGRSDYGPFLAQGLVAGGLFTGADGTKTKEERDYYDKLLGAGLGGIPGVIHDPCYHRACDSIENINVFALEKMIQAAAHMLEYLAQQENLEAWLYPGGRPKRLDVLTRSSKQYDTINEYFNLPYL